MYSLIMVFCAIVSSFDEDVIASKSHYFIQKNQGGQHTEIKLISVGANPKKRDRKYRNKVRIRGVNITEIRGST